MKRFLKFLILMLIITTLAVGLSACIETPEEGGTSTTVKTLSAPTNITVVNGVVNWDKVDNADGYIIEVTLPNTEPYKETVLSNSFVFDSSIAAASFKVLAVGAKGYKSSPASAATEIKKINAPSNVKIVRDELFWDAVDGAEGYIVFIADKEYDTTMTSFTLSRANEVNGNFSRIQVKAKGGTNKIGSDMSARLSASSVGTLNLVYEQSMTGAKISWNTLPNVDRYEISINGGPAENLSLVNTKDLVSLMDKPGRHNIVVTAKSSDPLKISASVSDSVMVEGAPTVSTTDGKIKFSNLGTADALRISYWSKGSPVGSAANGTITCGAEEFYEGISLPAGEWEISVRKEISITKKLIGSKESDRIITTKLAAPVASFVGGKIEWKAIAGAELYECQIRKSDGTPYGASSKKGDTNYNLNGSNIASGTYSMVVSAIAKKGQLNSDESIETTFSCLDNPAPYIKNKILYFRPLSTPSVDYYVSIDNNTKIKLSKENFNESTYEYYIGLEQINGLSAGNRTAKVFAVPQAGSASSTIASSGGSLGYSVLKAPEIKVTGEGTLVWEQDAKARSYQLNVSTNGASSIVNTTKTSFILEGFQEGTYDIVIQSIGDDGQTTVMDSSLQTKFTAHKLAAPTNLKITGSSLEWKAVNKVTKYEITARGFSLFSDNSGCATSEFLNKFTSLKEVEFKTRSIARNTGSDAFVASDWSCIGMSTSGDFFAGQGTKEDPFVINNYEQLKNIRNHTDKSFLLINDIYCENDSWVPTDFSGQFDGANYSITNFKAEFFGGKAGFFRTLKAGSIVKNLTIKNAEAYGSKDAKETLSIGILAAEIEERAQILQCSIFDSSIYTADVLAANIGMLAGKSSGLINSANVKRCVIIFTDTNKLISTTQAIDAKVYIGGLVGMANAVIEEVTVEGVISKISSLRPSHIIMFGGAVGHLSNAGGKNYLQKVRVLNSEVSAIAEVTSIDIGGMAGTVLGDVKLSYSDMSISLQAKAANVRVGGLATEVTEVVSRSAFSGKINVEATKNQLNGKSVSIAGLVVETSNNIENCYSAAAIQFENDNAQDTASKYLVGGVAVISKGGAFINCYADNTFVMPIGVAETVVASFVVENQNSFTSCYFNGDASIHPDVINGGVGSVKKCASSSMSGYGIYIGWDFTKIWKANGADKPSLL